jgi:hypothetical protein
MILIIGIAIILICQWYLKDPPVQSQQHDFQAPLLNGELEVSLAFEVRQGDVNGIADFKTRSQALVNQWGAGTEGFKGQNFYDPIQAQLAPLGAYRPYVVKAVDKVEVPLTPAEWAERELKIATEVLVSYIKNRESIDPVLEKHKIGDKSAKDLLVDITDARIKRVVNPSGITYPFRT